MDVPSPAPGARPLRRAKIATGMALPSTPFAFKPRSAATSVHKSAKSSTVRQSRQDDDMDGDTTMTESTVAQATSTTMLHRAMPLPSLSVGAATTLRGASTVVGVDEDEDDDVDAFAAALAQMEDEGDLEELLVGRDQHDVGDALVERFASICDERARELRALGVELDHHEMDGGAEELRQWELERNSWWLLRDLFIARLNSRAIVGGSDGGQADAAVVVYDGTDRQLVAEFQSNDPAVVEHVIIKDWLEYTAPPADTMEIRKLNHPYTVRELEAAHNRGTPTTSLEICPSPLDPDGVARSGRPLHMDDRRAEQTLLRSVFDCVRRGQMDKALRLCRAAGQPWRAVTLAGGIYFDDPNLVAPGSEVAGDTSTTPWDDGNAPTGNRNRGRWLLTCFQIANEPTFEDFERAVYAALCGNTTNVLPVCQSWEDRLWAYYNSLVVRMTEEHLRQFPRLTGDDHTAFTFPAIDTLMPTEIHHVLGQCSMDAVQREARQLFRKVQVSLMLNCTDAFMMEFEAAMTREDAIDVRYLRFVVHWILLARAASFPMADAVADRIIAAYVDMLVEAGKKAELVAMYSAKLPYDLQLEKMVAFLQAIAGSDMRRRNETLRKAYHYGLDVIEITKRTVEAVFSKYQTPAIASAQTIHNLCDPTDAADMAQILALEWLMIEQDQYLDALVQCNTLYRRFLLSGKVNAVQALRTRLLQTAPHFATATFVEAVRAKYGDTYENLIREHTHHILFLACVVEFNQWREIFARRPAADKTPSAAVAAIANGGDRTPWLVQFQRATSSVTETFGDVLTTTSTLSWLQDDVESFGNAMPEGYDAERRREEVQVLRGMYVPWLVQTMHHVLSSSAAYIPGNHREAMRLTMTVANEDHQLYREFLAGGDHARLESLLLAVRDDALELLDREGVAFPAE